MDAGCRRKSSPLEAKGNVATYCSGRQSGPLKIDSSRMPECQAGNPKDHLLQPLQVMVELQ